MRVVRGVDLQMSVLRVQDMGKMQEMLEKRGEKLADSVREEAELKREVESSRVAENSIMDKSKESLSGSKGNHIDEWV